MVRGQLLAACALTGVLLSGCSGTTTGRPQVTRLSPISPTASAPGQTAPSHTAPPAPSPTATAAPPRAAETLPAENGWSFVETKSGKTRCQLSHDEVGCESAFTNAPMVDGVQANGVRLTADGRMKWLVGNLGDPPVVPLDYRVYAAQGWTIDAGESGTKFTNDATGHGMTVAVDEVDVF